DRVELVQPLGEVRRHRCARGHVVSAAGIERLDGDGKVAETGGKLESRLRLADDLGTDAVARHHRDAVARGHCSGILRTIRSSTIAISTPQSIGLTTSCTVGGSELPTVTHTTVGIIAGTTTRITRARGSRAIPRAACTQISDSSTNSNAAETLSG